VKYYLATHDINNKQVRSLIKKLRTKGIHCINERNVISQLNKKTMNVHTDSWKEDAIKTADFILVFLTAGKGNLVNIGYALALKKKILVYSPEKDHYHIGKKSIFHNLPDVYICSGTFYRLEKTIRKLFFKQYGETDSLQLSNK
jgi:nucleoside 2-deoxyribosyltransferase